MRLLHDHHGHTLRALADDNGMANPSVLDAIERSRKRNA